MKLRFIALCAAAMCFQSLSAIQTSFWYASFNTPSNQPYVETYLSVIGNSVAFVKNQNGKYQASVEVSILFKQNNEIKAVQKYNLNSPEVADTLQKPNFIDQQRTSVAPGKYTIELIINDKNKIGKPLTHNQEVTVDFSTGVGFSDVELLESYTKTTNPGPLTKSGYDLIPYVANYYPDNIDRLKYYAEVYNTIKSLGANEKILLQQYIENADRKVKLDDLSTFSKQSTNEVNVILSEFNIAPLPTGNYNLVLEVRDKENKLVAQKKVFFQRVKKQNQVSYAMAGPQADSLRPQIHFATYINNPDSLKEFIRCLWPISSEAEKTHADNQLEVKDLKNMQNFFYSFWYNRDNNNPERAWLVYKAEVKKANAAFGAMNKKGYETDRGRVFLQYGPPDQLGDYPFEPSAYPYQIWMYYKIQAQGTRKFVFYNNSFQSNDYRLLHSDARGEVYEPNWELKLHQRSSNMPSGVSQDRNNQVPDQFGSWSKDVFNNPR